MNIVHSVHSHSPLSLTSLLSLSIPTLLYRAWSYNDFCLFCDPLIWLRVICVVMSLGTGRLIVWYTTGESNYLYARVYQLLILQQLLRINEPLQGSVLRRLRAGNHSWHKIVFAMALLIQEDGISQSFPLPSSSYIPSTSSSLMFPGLRKYGIHALLRAEYSVIYSKHLE